MFHPSISVLLLIAQGIRDTSASVLIEPPWPFSPELGPLTAEASLDAVARTPEGRIFTSDDFLVHY